MPLLLGLLILVTHSWTNHSFLPHVFIRRDSVKKPLEQPYDGPFKILSRTDKYYTLDINGKWDTVSIDRLKAAHLDSTHTLSPPSSPTLPPPLFLLPLFHLLPLHNLLPPLVLVQDAIFTSLIVSISSISVAHWWGSTVVK